jgi:hypothetical protein
MDYLATLEQWERLLFDHLEMSTSRPYDILVTLDSNNVIYSAIDGSIKDH